MFTMFFPLRVGLVAALFVFVAGHVQDVATDIPTDINARQLVGFRSEYVTGRLSIPGMPGFQTMNYSLVVSDIGPYPFGTVIRCAYVRSIINEKYKGLKMFND